MPGFRTPGQMAVVQSAQDMIEGDTGTRPSAKHTRQMLRGERPWPFPAEQSTEGSPLGEAVSEVERFGKGFGEKGL
jgi:hypothetical protein